MLKLARLLAIMVLAAAGAFPSIAFAQAPGTQIVGGTTITLGGGAQLLSLPDIDFTFKTDNSGAVAHKQTNSDLKRLWRRLSGLDRNAVRLLGQHPGRRRGLRLLRQCPGHRP